MLLELGIGMVALGIVTGFKGAYDIGKESAEEENDMLKKQNEELLNSSALLIDKTKKMNASIDAIIKSTVNSLDEVKKIENNLLEREKAIQDVNEANVVETNTSTVDVKNSDNGEKIHTETKTVVQKADTTVSLNDAEKLLIEAQEEAGFDVQLAKETAAAIKEAEDEESIKAFKHYKRRAKNNG